MKPVPTHFRRSGHEFEQVVREGDLAIYRQVKGRVVTWEVVRIRSHEGFEVDGRNVPPSEYYPSTGEWGVCGWTYTSEDDARRKFESLKSQQQNGELNK